MIYDGTEESPNESALVPTKNDFAIGEKDGGFGKKVKKNTEGKM